MTFVSHRPSLFLKYENMNFVLSAFPNLLLLSEKGKCMKVAYTLRNGILRHIGLLEADEDKIRKIRPKGTQVRMLYVPREAIRP